MSAVVLAFPASRARRARLRRPAGELVVLPAPAAPADTERERALAAWIQIGERLSTRSLLATMESLARLVQIGEAMNRQTR